MAPLTRAFVMLVGLSLGTTLLARLAPGTGPALVAAFLVLAGWKARVILNDYLGLRPSRVWRRGFNAIVTGFLMLGFGIYLLPLLT
ncbi:MAG: nitric oxide reductase F protein [Rhodobacteraceae bacterium]|nr:nitric oxide reductase F protein [Paracoccaceae bacterium]